MQPPFLPHCLWFLPEELQEPFSSPNLYVCLLVLGCLPSVSFSDFSAEPSHGSVAQLDKRTESGCKFYLLRKKLRGKVVYSTGKWVEIESFE